MSTIFELCTDSRKKGRNRKKNVNSLRVERKMKTPRDLR
jgi:hypothetical protein